MKLVYKMLLINIGAAIVFTILAMAMSGSVQASDVGIAFGLVCLGLGGLNLFVGFILALIPEQRQLGKSLLLSGAVLLLLSGISCGSAISGMRF